MHLYFCVIPERKDIWVCEHGVAMKKACATCIVTGKDATSGQLAGKISLTHAMMVMLSLSKFPRNKLVCLGGEKEVAEEKNDKVARSS